VAPVVVSTHAPAAALVPSGPKEGPHAPRNQTWWLHIERPSVIVPVAQAVLAAMRQGLSQFTSSSTLSIDEWLDALDVDQPVDLVMTSPAGGDRDGAIRFAIRSQEAFREALSKRGYEAADEPGDRMRVVPNGASKGDSGTLCDVSTAPVLVCGSDEGVEKIGPWLRTMPKPAGTRDDEARLVVERRGLAEFLPADLVEDVAGGSASLRVVGADAALDVQLRFSSSESRWTKALLAEPSPDAAPVELGRIPARADVAMVSDGAGPAGALLGMIRIFDALPAGDPARAAWAAVLKLEAKPWAFGISLDADEARAAAAALRSGTSDPKKLAEAVEGGLEAHGWLAVVADTASLEAAARGLAKPPSVVAGSATFQVRSAPPALRLPRGSFFLDSSRPIAGMGVRTRTSAAKSHVLFFPDGPVTWAVNGSDEARLGRFAVRLLAAPATPRPDLHVDASTVVSACVWDQAGATWRSVDPVPTTPGGRADAADAIERAIAATPSTLRVSLSRERPANAAGGTVSLHLAVSPSSVGTLVANLAQSAFSIAFFFAMLASGFP
jgi:hypothetical protein